ncbi:MAG TPA: adenine deaminase [Phycisphaerae bacterium]|nr:adenine deaminase [Phycisphaerae bacterium]
MAQYSGERTRREVQGNIVDVYHRRIFPGLLHIEAGRIASISECPVPAGAPFILPGFIDAHIHIESSMLIPREFARLAIPHGTVATVSDPHEIANVLGVPGVEFMLEDAALSPLKTMFGAPPCVPATCFETAGACLGVAEVKSLLAHPRVGYLAEVMNYPGVIAGDPDLLAKIESAKTAGKPIDGHAPGLRGQGVSAYFSSGITTDHECFSLEEALEKLAAAPDLHILIREGSAAKNFDALHPLLRSHPDRVMLCSDDKHPNDLILGHINQLVIRAVALGYDLFDVLRAACLNPVLHYKLPVGTLRPGEPADFIEVGDLHTFRNLRTWIDGNIVAESGECLISRHPSAGPPPNRFVARPVSPEDCAIRATGAHPRVNIIEAEDGQLVTARVIEELLVQDGKLLPDLRRDTLKIAVINRYDPSAKPAIGFIRGFRMKRGAIASSVAHDSHNLVVVGVDDASIARAANLVIAHHGGLAVVDRDLHEVLPLPVGGIMTDQEGAATAHAYGRIDQIARDLADNAGLSAPFMTLSFMALLVIPSLKMSDRGLFDGEHFDFIPPCCD